MSSTDAVRGRFRAPSDTMLVLCGAYFLLVTLYAWQAWRRETITILTDELEFSQISRAISETGRPGRRGEAFGFTSLAPWFTAPLWWIQKVSTAYEAIKYFQAIVMALAIFPAHAMARRVLSKPWALFAAIGTIAAPALSYSPILVEEPFAYPIAITALWLIILAIERPTWRSVGLAAVASVVGVLTRGQLTALVATLVVSLGFLGWSSAPMLRWRSTWTTRDRVGAAVLGLGFLFFVSSLLAWQSQNYADVTAQWKGRIVEYGAWALGGFSIGLGIIPVVALLSVPFLRGEERERPELRAFLLVSASATGAFLWYTAIKGAYLSTEGFGGIVERNLIYLTPLAFVATGLVLERVRPPAWAIAGSSLVVIGALLWTPLDRGVNQFPYYEAHGLAILAFLNREWSWPLSRIETAAWIAPIVAGGLLIAVTSARSRVGSVGRWLPFGIALFVLAWNQTNQIYAAIGEHNFSRNVAKNLPNPPDWIDEAIAPEKATILGQFIQDGSGVWDNEFWNRSIARVWSVDGSTPGPGLSVTPDLVKPDGTLWPRPPTPYVLQLNGVELVGAKVARNGGATLVRLGEEFRLRWNQEDVSPDGWTTGKDGARVSRAAYNRFDTSEDGDALIVVTLSRETFCPPGRPPIPSNVVIKLGPIAVSSAKEPALGSVLQRARQFVPGCTRRGVAFPAPKVPWRLEITAETFVPRDISPDYSSDTRSLGVRPTIDVVPR